MAGLSNSLLQALKLGVFERLFQTLRFALTLQLNYFALELGENAFARLRGIVVLQPDMDLEFFLRVAWLVVRDRQLKCATALAF